MFTTNRLRTSMYVIRDIFTCKPGKSRQLAEMFKASMATTPQIDGFQNGRIMVDMVADYWTVVLEAEVESLETFERGMAQYASRPEFRKSLEGYMDLVLGGKREIFRTI
jgi:hypothetical protein